MDAAKRLERKTEDLAGSIRVSSQVSEAFWYKGSGGTRGKQKDQERTFQNVVFSPYILFLVVLNLGRWPLESSLLPDAILSCRIM